MTIPIIARAAGRARVIRLTASDLTVENAVESAVLKSSVRFEPSGLSLSRYFLWIF
jgi:hypothetical protein